MKIDRMERSLKLMQFDVEYRCFGSIAGMDEVGRGPFAGNVVAACVMMPEAPLIEGIDDSKKISEKRREELYERIMEVALHVGIGQIGPEEIDRINILQATRRAMEQAASRIPAEVFLIDAVTGLQLKGHQMPLIKGDARSYHIAAASIVAKVTRDRDMIRMAEIYPEYGFERNKGYGTAEHIEALRKHGPCPIHRRTFIQKYL